MQDSKLSSAYERWTWDHCSTVILSLKGRRGYTDRLWVLGFELLDNGSFIDPFHGIEVFNPSNAGNPLSIPYNYSAIPEMYCLLFTYATASETNLTGDHISPNSGDLILRFELEEIEIIDLLQYAAKDFNLLKAVSSPFFDSILSLGDLSFKVWPFPHIPVTFVLWQGDKDVPPGATILFDRSINLQLPGLEVELAGLTVWRLRNILDRAVKWGYHQFTKQ